MSEQIQAAAEAFLATRPLAALTIDEVMQRTGLARTNFYRFFADRQDLLLQVLARANRELADLVTTWTEGAGAVEDDLDRSIRGLVAAYARHGALFRAFAEGAAQEEALGTAWRRVTDHFVAATRDRIERDRAAGHSRVEDAESTAQALVLMTEAFMRRACEDGAPDEARVTATLVPIWAAAVRGPAAEAQRAG